MDEQQNFEQEPEVVEEVVEVQPEVVEEVQPEVVEEVQPEVVEEVQPEVVEEVQSEVVVEVQPEPEPEVEVQSEVVVEVQPEPEPEVEVQAEVVEEPEEMPELEEVENIVAEVMEIMMFDNVIVQPPVAPVEVRQPAPLAAEPTLIPLFGRRSARRNPGMRLYM